MENNGLNLQQRPKGYVRFVVVLMGLISLLDNYLAQVELYVIDDMVSDWQIPKNELLLLISAFGVITFAVFFISWITDAFGRRKGLILLVLCLGIPATLLIFTPSGPAGMNIGIVLYSLITMATLANTWEIPVAEEAPPKKRGLFGGIAFLMGLLPFYAIVGPRISQALNWKYAYGLWGIIFMIICIPLLIFKFKEPERWVKSKTQRKNKLLNIKQALRSMTKRDWLYILVLSGVYFMWSAIFKMGTLSFRGYYISLELGPQYDSTYLPIGGVLTVVGALLSGFLMDKVGRRLTLVIGCGGSIASFIILSQTGSPAAMWGIFIFMPIILAWITVYFTEIFPTKIRGTCMGTVVTFSRVAYIAGPALASLYIIGWSNFWILAGLLMIIPLLALLVKPYEAMGKTIEEIESKRDAK